MKGLMMRSVLASVVLCLLESTVAYGNLPACCPLGYAFDYGECISVGKWEPFIPMEADAHFDYKGFPSCKHGKMPIKLHADDIFFNPDTSINLPYYVQLHPAQPDQYCITKISSPEITCEETATKVYVCLGQDLSAGEWTGVGIAHLLVLVTILTYFSVQELRSLQGQYMICWLISLLLYNICLFPGSTITLNLNYVSCIALGAVKYFFFCGVMMWFNVICFDIWRTMKCGQDISGRRRFVLYCVYTWVLGAILTTVVIILPFVNTGPDSPENKATSQLMDGNSDSCSLKMEMNMILTLTLVITMVLNFIFLSLASSSSCSYTKFGNGLCRNEAFLALKQGWKLFSIMAAFTYMAIPQKIVSNSQLIHMWIFVLLESAAIFGIFAYRKTVITIFKQTCCRRFYGKPVDGMSEHEKGQLTTMH